ncbi:MAG: hypothetical protein J6C52_07820 [Clostridia bacterium]|nr:hypothetical protein [Clostridia bacterium]
MLSIEKSAYSLSIDVQENGASFAGGMFGGLALAEAPVFELLLESLTGREPLKLTSLTGWKRVRARRYGDTIRLHFAAPENTDGADITVAVIGTADDAGISWTVDVINDSENWSAAELVCPTPKVAGTFDLLTPAGGGRLHPHAHDTQLAYRLSYPNHNASMQFYAFVGDGGGLYLGAHDPDAALKSFRVETGGGCGRVEMLFPAIGAGLPANSFSLYGCIRWQAFAGDWYDAALIYRDFVHTYAKWLPKIGENGRDDTPDRFKEVAFWIADYIPNSPSQRDVRPMQLAAVSDRYPKDYWYAAPIELRQRLGVPIAYHVYNWHEIPFNINYPHFLPAKEEFIEGAKKLREGGVLVCPYINAYSWESEDAEEGYDMNFRDVGSKGGAVSPDGSFYLAKYPQMKENGKNTLLAGMCPTFHRWHQIIDGVAREMEATLPIDGIYFDEIAAHAPHSCRGKGHLHLPGGGSYWVEGYNRMMEKIRMEKPEGAFYFSESSGEPFMKSFDGYLTWLWIHGDDVPVFPLIYAGYIQMLGRYTDGATRDDDDHFRYHLAESLLFGQQPGWINAHVVYNEKRMAFLETIVRTRHRYTKLFNGGKLLRPPHVATDTPPKACPKGGMMAQVVAGAWQRDGKTVLFLINVAEEESRYSLRFDAAEYGVTALPDGFEREGDLARREGVLAGGEVVVWEME